MKMRARLQGGTGECGSTGGKTSKVRLDCGINKRARFYFTRWFVPAVASALSLALQAQEHCCEGTEVLASEASSVILRPREGNSTNTIATQMTQRFANCT